MDKNKLDEFVELAEQLQTAVKNIGKASRREDVDELELATKRITDSMQLKLPYVYGCVHDIASRRRSKIATGDLNTALGE